MHQFGVGLERVDVAAATKLGVLVARVPGDAGGNADSCAELAVLHLLALSRRLDESRRVVAERRWPDRPLGRSLLDSTVLIVGLGAIGVALARRLAPFGPRLLAVRARPELGGPPEVELVGGPGQLPDMLGQADAVMCCALLHEGNGQMFGPAEFAAMKPGALFVNVARGGLVDEAALLAALESGHVGGAGLDVFAREPADPQSPLVQHPLVIATPHIGWHTGFMFSQTSEVFAANLMRYGRGERPQWTVNEPAVPPDAGLTADRGLDLSAVVVGMARQDLREPANAPLAQRQISGVQAVNEGDYGVAAAPQVRRRVGLSDGLSRRCVGGIELIHQLRADRGILAGDDSADPGADVVAGVSDMVHDHADSPAVPEPGEWRGTPHIVGAGLREHLQPVPRRRYRGRVLGRSGGICHGQNIARLAGSGPVLSASGRPGGSTLTSSDYRRIKDSLVASYQAGADHRDKQAKRPWKLAERDAFLARLRAEGAVRLLEIGAGTGQDSVFFASGGLDVMATDMSAAMVARCRDKGLDARVMDFSELDFETGSFDAVHAMNCLLHVPNAELPAVLTAIARVLRPGGLFFLGVYGGRAEEGEASWDDHVPARFFSFRTDDQLLQFASQCFEVVDFHVVPDVGGHKFQSLTLRLPAPGAAGA